MKKPTRITKKLCLIALLLTGTFLSLSSSAEVFFKCQNDVLGRDVCVPTENKDGIDGITILASSVYDLLDSTQENTNTVCILGSVAPSECTIAGDTKTVAGNTFTSQEIKLGCVITPNNDGTTSAECQISQVGGGDIPTGFESVIGIKCKTSLEGDGCIFKLNRDPVLNQLKDLLQDQGKQLSKNQDIMNKAFWSCLDAENNNPDQRVFCEALIQQIIGGHHPVYQTPVQRFLGAEDPVGHHQFQ